MTDTGKVRQALLRAAFAQTKSLSLIRELKRIYETREYAPPLALKG